MRSTRLAAVLLLAIALGAAACERIAETGDGMRRSTERRWDQGRRGIPRR